MKKDIDALEKVQKRATEILPQLKHMNYRILIDLKHVNYLHYTIEELEETWSKRIKYWLENMISRQPPPWLWFVPQ